ncbi:hypothetical protein MPER_06505 [Moniliophthora perniciosa FA553]|nr:hypothetical protein MPER_06505 [Moniliophthora perniciosa FA553]
MCIGHFMNGFWTGHFRDETDDDVHGLIQFRVSNWDESNGSFDGEGCHSRGSLRVLGSFDRSTNSLEATFIGEIDEGISASEQLYIFMSGSLDEIVFSSASLPNQFTISDASLGLSNQDIIVWTTYGSSLATSLEICIGSGAISDPVPPPGTGQAIIGDVGPNPREYCTSQEAATRWAVI